HLVPHNFAYTVFDANWRTAVLRHATQQSFDAIVLGFDLSNRQLGRSLTRAYMSCDRLGNNLSVIGNDANTPVAVASDAASEVEAQNGRFHCVRIHVDPTLSAMPRHCGFDVIGADIKSHLLEGFGVIVIVFNYLRRYMTVRRVKAAIETRFTFNNLLTQLL